MELAAVDDRRNEKKEKGGKKKEKKKKNEEGGTKQTSAVHQATNSEVVCSRGGSCTGGVRPGGCVDAGRGKMNSTKGESNCQKVPHVTSFPASSCVLLLLPVPATAPCLF